MFGGDFSFVVSILAGLFYHSSPATDRYMDLMQTTAKFTAQSLRTGLSHVIAIGASEIGMEFLIHRLAANFNSKVYVSAERRAFLDCMGLDYDTDTLIQKLRRLLVTNPNDALIHVLPIDDISHEVSLIETIAKNYFKPQSRLRHLLKSTTVSSEFLFIKPNGFPSIQKLTVYKERHNYMRALGIRPRGCDSVLQTVVDGVVEIVGKVVGST